MMMITMIMILIIRGGICGRGGGAEADQIQATTLPHALRTALNYLLFCVQCNDDSFSQQKIKGKS